NLATCRRSNEDPNARSRNQSAGTVLGLLPSLWRHVCCIPLTGSAFRRHDLKHTNTRVRRESF
ncbi:hypothetical protein HAX54_020044, partial [Datura stramonium]|nr:hypothetical protein [Datura stramonium]